MIAMEKSIFITETEKVIGRLQMLSNFSEVARRAGVSASTLSKLASGASKNPTVSMMARIQRALDDSISKNIADDPLSSDVEPTLNGTAGDLK